MITYASHVKPFGSNFKLIEIDEDVVKKAREFTTNVITAKKKEQHHFNDNRSHYKRFLTGILGELALEKFLNTSGIVDWNIGNSINFHQPDLKAIGVNSGVKTVEYGSFPVIFKKSFSNEIIMIKWKENQIYLCGLATKNVLNHYQSIELINDRKLRERGTKTGFYGFEHLQNFDNLQDLIRITAK